MPTREFTVAGDSFDVKERVKQAIDIVDLVGSHIQLRRQGRNYVGLCPWHDDSRPSLQVNPERQSFKCWVCDIGGDVFSFVMKMEGVEFREALHMLAERAGIAIEKRRRRRSFAGADPLAMVSAAGEESSDVPDGSDMIPRPPDDGTQTKRTLLQAAAWAEKQYHECLLRSPEAEAARRYLAERGISAESIERFHLGFSPLERDWILRGVREGGDLAKFERRAKILETIGILIRPAEGGKLFDRFRGRLLFSIRDAQGRPVGIGGRILPEGITGGSPQLCEAPEASGQMGTAPFLARAKYVNSPETPLFTKSKLLYGLDLARESIRKTRTALVMEGYTDVIVAHQYGFTNAVAVLGTALGEEHIKILKRQADRVRIVLVLDGDEAGMKRANEVLELFVAQQADLDILTLPENLDPCDYLRSYGAGAFEELLERRAVDALEHAFAVATQGVDVDRDVHGVGRAIERLLGIVARAPRLSGATTGDARIQEQKILQRLAAKFRVEESSLRRRLAELRRRGAARPAARALPPEQQSVEENASPPPSPWESAVLQLIAAHPDCFPAVRERFGEEPMTNPSCQRIYDVCRRLADEGAAPTYDRMMLAIDEPALQSLLVEIDETARATDQASADPLELLNGLYETFQRREIERRRPAQIGALREGRLDVAQQAAMLDEIVRRKREGMRD